MVDNSQFHIVILVADGALSNVLVKKYEALLLQIRHLNLSVLTSCSMSVFPNTVTVTVRVRVRST